MTAGKEAAKGGAKKRGLGRGLEALLGPKAAAEAPFGIVIVHRLYSQILNSGSLAAGVTVAAVLVALNTAENPIPKFVKRSNKVDKIKVDASITAKPFFEKFGFKEVRKNLVKRGNFELVNFSMERV